MANPVPPLPAGFFLTSRRRKSLLALIEIRQGEVSIKAPATSSGLVVVVAVFAILAVLSLADIMTAALDHNEHMYLSAGALLKDHVLYRDFAFFQMPYQAVLHRLLFAVVDTTWLLFAGRILSWLLWLGCLAAIFFIVRESTGGRLAPFGAVVLLAFNRVVGHAAGEASNYLAPILASYLAVFFIFRRAARPAPSPKDAFFAGIFLGLGIGFKLYYAALLIPFGLTLLLAPRSRPIRERLARGLAPLFAGSLLALLPALCYVLAAPASFWFDNVEYHRLTASWRALTGFSIGMSWPEKLRFVIALAIRPTNLFLLVGIVALARPFRKAADQDDASRTEWHFRALFCRTAFGAALFTALLPSPLWDQYFAFPLSFAILLFLVQWERLARLYPRPALAAHMILLGLQIAVGGTELLSAAPAFARADTWTPIRLHWAAQRLQWNLPDTGSGKVATLSPLLALEAGRAIYPELSAGPFCYRLGELLTAEQARRFACATPGSLEQMLAADPPAAIVVGLEEGQETQLVAAASKRGLRRVPLGFEGATAYVATAATEGAVTLP